MRSLNIGVLWFFLSLIISALNDSAVKYISPEIGFQTVLQYRFLFATLTLLPFAFLKANEFKTKRISLHLVRGVILFLAMFLWCSALPIVKITCATLISFTIPIFILILAPIFLNERISSQLWVATAICFAGIAMILEVGEISYNGSIFKMLISAFLFATLDIINKKFITKEPMMVMLFYSNLITLTLSIIAFGGINLNIGWFNLLLMLMLGIGANGILYCVLKAFSYIDASLLSPYRYLELIISFWIGYIVFDESLTTRFALGALVIICTTLYVNRKLNNKEKSIG